VTWERSPGGILVPVKPPAPDPVPDRKSPRGPFPERCECGAEWTLISEYSSSTCVGFNGHDDNCKTRIVWCANEHRRTVGIRRVCDPDEYDDIDHRGEVHAKCDWKGQTECCGPYLYVDTWPELEVKPERRDTPPTGSPLRYMDGI